MLKKIYIGILSLFIIMLLFINLVSAISSKSISAFFNPSFVKDRSNATILLLQHILFESGLIPKKQPVEMINAAINKIAQEQNINPDIINLIVANSMQYAIYHDGTIGLMRVKPSYLSTGKDPFIITDNIEAGIEKLSTSIRRNGLEQALNEYLEPDLAKNIYTQYQELKK